MKFFGLLLLTLALAVATSATAQVPSSTQQRAATGDVAGGRFIPPQILQILADPRIDPNVAYILWQTSRKPMDDWTVSELGFATQAAATLVEVGIPLIQVQTLYQFWGLDPNDVFNPSFGSDWQSRSTAYDPRNAGNVGAISSSDCQVNVSQMTVGTFRQCAAGGAQN